MLTNIIAKIFNLKFKRGIISMSVQANTFAVNEIQKLLEDMEELYKKKWNRLHRQAKRKEN